MSIFDAVKRANRPGPPEHSITLRVACAGAVVTGIRSRDFDLGLPAP